MEVLVYFVVVVLCRLSCVLALTFKLPGKERQCFFQDIAKGVPSIIEFQVVAGGEHDIDLDVIAPDQSVIHTEHEKSWGSYEWNTTQAGQYQFCFSNEYSSFTDKVLYVNAITAHDEFEGYMANNVALTLLETAYLDIHESLSSLEKSQTHFRLSEMGGRMFADYLNTRVCYWSLAEVVVVIVIGFGQVILMKTFFTDKKTTGGSTFHS